MPVLSGSGACLPPVRLPLFGVSVTGVEAVSRVLPGEGLVVVVEVTVRVVVAGAGLVLWSEQAASASAPIRRGARRGMGWRMVVGPPFFEFGRMVIKVALSVRRGASMAPRGVKAMSAEDGAKRRWGWHRYLVQG